MAKKKSESESSPAASKSHAKGAEKETTDASAAGKKPAAKKPATKKTAEKKGSEKKSAPSPMGVPMIDTGAAAQVAATMIAKKVDTSTSAESGAGAKKPSAAFQQLKNNLAKPPSSVMGNLLGGVQNKKNQGHSGFAKQVGHNQTFGADVNRTGVPRRTGGG
jgi:hypothetical protein